MVSLKTKNPSVTTVASTTVFDFLNKKIHSFNMAITTNNLNI